MRNVRVLLAYDGSPFFGWQRQDGFDTVQEALEDALEALVGDKVVVHGAGRTDTGVHALGQVAHFHVETRLADDRVRHALNHYLPPTVRCLRLETCDPGFHARFHAKGKRYAYVTATQRFRPPFAPHLCHWIPEPLDLGAMRRAAAVLVGRPAFSAFATVGSPRRDNVRTLSAVRIVARKRRFAVFVQGDGFLYNMVRTIAGTLFEVGRGKLGPRDVVDILASGERERAGPTAPAAGLYLVAVRYPEKPFVGPDAGPAGTPGLFA